MMKPIARVLSLAFFALSLSACGLQTAEDSMVEIPSAAAPISSPVASVEQALRGAPLEWGGSKPIACGVTCERTSCEKCCEAHDTCETSCSVGGYARCNCIN